MSAEQPHYFQLAKRLHELEVGESFFVKKSEWTSGKTPYEKLTRISKATKKEFTYERKYDNSGWYFKREW